MTNRSNTYHFVTYKLENSELKKEQSRLLSEKTRLRRSSMKGILHYPAETDGEFENRSHKAKYQSG